MDDREGRRLKHIRHSRQIVVCELQVGRRPNSQLSHQKTALWTTLNDILRQHGTAIEGLQTWTLTHNPTKYGGARHTLAPYKIQTLKSIEMVLKFLERKRSKTVVR
ncbi:hypothetical protein BGX20_004468 [Mortierella sp. AD010]|nr:hypothetical protein BGX20_004468 [Mortierella sp. AD010]